MTFLRITDDGCGMEPVDARTAFLRHATSKIRKKEDLACIGTLGFRGEALAAISSVSKSICSRGRRARKTAFACISKPERFCLRSLSAARAARRFWCGSCFTTRPRG